MAAAGAAGAAGMSFAAPWMWLLALIPVAGVALQIALGRRGEDRHGLPAMLRAVASGGKVRAGASRRQPPWRFWLGFLLLVAALARPQWGAKPDAGDKRAQVLIALDLSRSMLATDALPSRIERARTIALRLVRESPAADIGLAAFAGEAYLLAAPSADRAVLRTFLPAVSPDQMIVPGSDLRRLLLVAERAFDGRAASRTIVLLSDGEAEPTPWRQALPRLRAAGIHVVSVGLGTAKGAHIRQQARDLVGPSGTAVTTRLHVDGLREMATATGGFYLDAAQSQELAGRLRKMSEAEAAAMAARPGEARQDRFAWFLGPALLLLLWSTIAEWPALPRLMRLRPRWTRPASYAVAAALVLTAYGPRGLAVKPPPISLELHGSEPDPLIVVKNAVTRMLGERHPSAAEYMTLTQAAIRYGEVHRQHAHVLQRGVMEDGLAAIAAGKALDPSLPGWIAAHTKLVRLLKDPHAVQKPDKGDVDPANDPIDAKLDAPMPQPQKPEGQKDDKQPSNGQDQRQVGGTQRTKAEEAEWRVPSLAKPLYTLQKLRAADRPGELFRLIQQQQPAPPRRNAQTW